MNTIKVLKETRSLLQTSYTKGTIAVDSAGNQTHPNHPSACQFCLIGALGKYLIEAGELPKPPKLTYGTADDLYNTVEEAAPGRLLLEIAEKKYGYRKLWLLNDNVGQDATLAVIDEAIQKLEQTK